jgi:hypothetical protein
LGKSAYRACETSVLILLEQTISSLLKEKEENRWISVDEKPFPIDGKRIERFHKLWKCVISVNRNNGRFPESAEWVTLCLSQSWPEEAFLPFWRPATLESVFPTEGEAENG